MYLYLVDIFQRHFIKSKYVIYVYTCCLVATVMIVMETEGIQSCSDKQSLKTPHRNIKTVLPCVCVCVFVRVCVWPFCFKSKQC